MTEQTKEQISVFMDDELSAQECEFFVRRLQKDPESRRQFIRYQVIGAAIRGENVVAEHGDLRVRLQAALSGDAGAVRNAPRPRLLRRLSVGAGIAAGIAIVAFLTIRVAELGIGPGGAPSVAQADRQLERLETPSYLVPRRAPEIRLAGSDIRLTGLQYLMHHGGHTSNLRRTVVHSNVVAGVDNDAVAQTAIWEDVSQ